MPNSRPLPLVTVAFALAVVPAVSRAQAVTAYVPVGVNPQSLALNPVTNKIYVANWDGTVTIIDGASNNTLSVGAGSGPYSVAVNPLTNRIYVANYSKASVTVIDAGNNNALSSVVVGTNPYSMAVNPNTNKIYVANVGSANVTVIDGATNTPKAVATGVAPDAVAVNPVTNTIYVANANSASVTVIDGASNNTSAIAAGQRPDAVAVNAVTNKIYVANGNDQTVTVIDGASKTVDATLGVGQGPTSVDVNPVTNRIYVANEYSASVTVIDGASHSTYNVSVGTYPVWVAADPVTNKIFVDDFGGGVTVIDGVTNVPTFLPATGAYPTAAALNPITDKFYVANYGSNNVTVVDGAVNSTTSITAGLVPNAVAANAATNTVYVANTGDGTVTVIDGSGNLTSIVPVGNSPIALLANPLTNETYVANSRSNNVSVINGFVYAVVATLTTGSYPIALDLNPVTNKIYVANAGGGTVTVINGSTNVVTANVTVGNGPLAVAVNPVTNKIYVPNAYDGTVTLIDGATDTVTATLPVGTYPNAVAVNSVTNKIYVANAFSNNVTVIDGVFNSTISVPVGTSPYGVAVNSVTNKIYVTNSESNSVTVIDGLTDTATATVPTGNYPFLPTVNPVTNKIYIGNVDDTSVTVIDGVSNFTSTVAVGNGPGWIAVNPVTNHIFVACGLSNTVTVIDEQPVQAIPLTTSITRLAGNETSNPTPTFTFNAQSTTIVPPNALFFQVDTWQNAWTAASGSDPTFTGKLASLQPGLHVLYAYAADGQEATATEPGSPLTGSIQAYEFLVTQPLAPQAIAFNAIPSQIVGALLTLNATASSGLPVSFTSATSNICTVSGTTASLIAAGTCTIVASQPGNATYAPATPVSQSFSVNANSGSSSAKYDGLDSATEGTWTGKYGADGYLIANDATKPPAYASVSLTGDSTYTWAASTTDTRALQTASGASTRIAATYYSSTTFSINVNLTDGNAHKLSLYLLDWDGTARAESISILDAASNAVLDTEKFSSFHNGAYAAWTITGHVLIQVTKTAGSNAVVSGIFFDASPASASYLGTDTSTQGTWTGKYGSKGDIIANDASNVPSYAAVALSGDTAYTWAASTTDVRALQTSSGASTRIASTYYSSGSFTINLNLTDGNTHKVSLYLLDWDSTVRAETVTILDAASNAVLNTQTYSSFHNGEYAEWNLKGHVLIQVKKTAGSNAVVSAMFFD